MKKYLIYPNDHVGFTRRNHRSWGYIEHSNEGTSLTFFIKPTHFSRNILNELQNNLIKFLNNNGFFVTRTNRRRFNPIETPIDKEVEIILKEAE